MTFFFQSFILYGLYFIFSQKTCFLSLYLLKRSKTYLKRQISSRGSGCNFSCPKLIGERQSYDIFFQPFILCGFCLYFNFLPMPSLIEYDKPLFFFYVVSVAGAARREHNSSFPKNSSISPIETSFVRAAVPSMTGTKQTRPYVLRE